MSKFTTVVLYPGRFRAVGMTYVAHIWANDAFAARRVGALQAQQKQTPALRGKLSDWMPLVVFAGHLDALAFGWQLPDPVEDSE